MAIAFPTYDEQTDSPAEEPSPADAALVAAAQADPRAFAPLYRRYVDPVYRYCLRRLGTKEAAEDATALVFAKALAALPRYADRGGGSFRAWIFAIAHNAVVNDRRAARPHRHLPLDAAAPLADPAAGPEALALAAAAGASLATILARLPDDQRRLLELRLAGLATAEIAVVLGRSSGAVRVAQFRALARLRHLLAVQAETETETETGTATRSKTDTRSGTAPGRQGNRP